MVISSKVKVLQYLVDDGSDNSSSWSGDEKEVEVGGWNMGTRREEGNEGSCSMSYNAVDEVVKGVNEKICFILHLILYKYKYQFILNVLKRIRIIEIMK